MKVLQVSTPDTTTQTITLEKPCHGILFKYEFAHTLEESTANSVNLLDKIVATSTASAKLIDKGGNVKPLFNNIPMQALFELSQFEEGSHRFEGNWGYFYLPLGYRGNVPFNNDENLEITLNVVDDYVVGVLYAYAVESHQFTNLLYEYEQLTVGTDVKEKEFDVTKFEKIAIPVSALTASLELMMTNSNGHTSRYSKDELYSIGMLSNDKVYGGYITATTSGNNTDVHLDNFGKYIILDVSSFKNIQISRTSTTAFDIIAQMTYIVAKVSNKVKEKNIMIRDLAGERLTKISNQVK